MQDSYIRTFNLPPPGFLADFFGRAPVSSGEGVRGCVDLYCVDLSLKKSVGVSLVVSALCLDPNGLRFMSGPERVWDNLGPVGVTA